MATQPIPTIDFSETFPVLPRPPIVEAAVEFRGAATNEWDITNLQATLRRELPDYPVVKVMQSVSATAQFSITPPGATQAESENAMTQVHSGFLGFRMESGDGQRIAFFKRDGFALSKVHSYRQWQDLVTEAMRLWRIHQRLAQVAEMARIGVRFINRLEVPVADGVDFQDYFKNLGDAPGDLPSSGFLYRDHVTVPGHPYAATVTRTFTTDGEERPTSVAILLDIDVACLLPIPPEEGTMARTLSEMRWVKNRVFFHTLTERALDLCR